jgi:hypothetical protein
MPFDDDAFNNSAEGLRLLDLAIATTAGQDLVLLVENNGTPVEGESVRPFEDGKKRMDALGYMLTGGTRQRTDATGFNLLTSDLAVVRQCDAATASLWNLFKNQNAANLKVQLSVFKSGGDDAPDAQPTLEIVLEQARIAALSTLTSSRVAVPCELLFFSFSHLEIRSAPQLASGQRGAVRTCSIDMLKR